MNESPQAAASRASNRSATLLVFARQPIAGHVKRRLGRTIGGNRSARIYHQLLNRTLHEAMKLPQFYRVLMAASKRECPWFRQRLNRLGWLVSCQNEGDLGARMTDAFSRFECSSRPILLLGSDIADWRADDIRRACRALASVDVVLGPARDGGYWLIGMREPQPVLFEHIDWSTSEVLTQTLERIHQAQLSYAFVPTRRDIDRARDIGWLRRVRRAL